MATVESGHFLDGLDPDRRFGLAEARGAALALERQVLAMRRVAGRGAGGGAGLVGLGTLVRRLIQAVIIDEHCLIESSPGLAKTLAVRTLAGSLGLVYRRIQFVPDLMPSDLIQRERLNIDEAGRAEIQWRPGPIFTNLLLADEINRASPKAQAALLEVTEERQVSPLYRDRMLVRPREPLDEGALLDAPIAEVVGRRVATTPWRDGGLFGEDRLAAGSARGQVFVLLATMNPIEQEGVYPLSEAQLDRFAFHVILPYPEHGDLQAIGRHAFDPTADGLGAGRPPGPAEHLKTLYFVARLRSLLFGPDALDHWMGPGNALLRDRITDLVDFTHLRRGESPDDTWRDDGWPEAEPDEDSKDWRLRLLLKQWEAERDGGGPLADYADRMLALAADPSYPQVLSGSSPRGMLKLIRAAHAEAFLNGHFDDPNAPRIVVPEWDDIAAVACDVLRHRVRLTTSSTAMGMRPESIIRELLRWVETRPRPNA